MFIVNINEMNEDCLFICDKHLANIIMQHNIPLLGIYKDKYYFNPVVVRVQRKQAELTKRQFNILNLTKHDKTDEEEYFNTYFMERGEQDLDYVIFSGNKSVYLVYLETQFIIDVLEEQIRRNKVKGIISK